MADKITDKTEVSTTELATILGISARRVQQMAQDGTIVAVKKGRFNLSDSVKSYIAFLASKTKEISKSEQEKLDAELTIKKSKAIVAALEAKELRGKMHRAEDVAAMMEDLIYAMRAAFKALPGRLSVDVAPVSSAAECSEIIRKEANKAMKELSEYRYDPQKYAERVRARKDWEVVGDSDE